MRNNPQPKQPLYSNVYYVDLEKLLKDPTIWKNIHMVPIKATNDGLTQIEVQDYLISPIILNSEKFNDEYPCTILEYPNSPSPLDNSQNWIVRLLPTGSITTNKEIKSNLSIEALRDIEEQRKRRQYHMSH